MGLIAKKGVSLAPNTNGYYEWLPSGYATTKKYPLFIFLHGRGKLGNGTTQLDGLLTEGLPMYLNQQGFPVDAIVVCPQFGGWPAANQIENVITSCILTYNIDASRIYLTGLSMGGGETMNTAAISSRLAAVLAVCPASSWTQAGVDNMVKNNLPVISFHAKDDGIVNVSNTDGWIDNLNKAGIKPAAKKVIFETGGHNIWNTVYDYSYKVDGLNWFEWLMQYVRGVSISSSTTTTTTKTASASSLKLAVAPVEGWAEDSAYRQGGNYNNTQAVYGRTELIKNTSEQALFNQEVWGKNINYKIPVQNGNYILRLHFVELYHNAPGRRIFNVNVQGALLLQNFDVFASVSKFSALTKEFPIFVSNGELNISLSAISDNATISGIELIKTDGYQQTVVVEYKDVTGTVVKKYTDTFNHPVTVTVK